MPREPLRWTLESGWSRVPRRRRSARAELADLPALHSDHSRHAGDSLEQCLGQLALDLAVEADQATCDLDLDLVPRDRGRVMDEPDHLAPDRLVTAEENLQQLR